MEPSASFHIFAQHVWASASGTHSALFALGRLSLAALDRLDLVRSLRLCTGPRARVSASALGLDKRRLRTQAGQSGTIPFTVTARAKTPSLTAAVTEERPSPPSAWRPLLPRARARSRPRRRTRPSVQTATRSRVRGRMRRLRRARAAPAAHDALCLAALGQRPDHDGATDTTIDAPVTSTRAGRERPWRAAGRVSGRANAVERADGLAGGTRDALICEPTPSITHVTTRALTHSHLSPLGVQPGGEKRVSFASPRCHLPPTSGNWLDSLRARFVATIGRTCGLAKRATGSSGRAAASRRRPGKAASPGRQPQQGASALGTRLRPASSGSVPSPTAASAGSRARPTSSGRPGHVTLPKPHTALQRSLAHTLLSLNITYPAWDSATQRAAPKAASRSSGGWPRRPIRMSGSSGA